jgi:hypothetical protein
MYILMDTHHFIDFESSGTEKEGVERRKMRLNVPEERR